MAYESTDPSVDPPPPPSGTGDNPDFRDALGESAGIAGSSTDLGRSARARAERVRASAARGLDSAAGAVHAGGDRVASAAHRTGDALESGAEYLRGNGTGEMIDDFKGLLRSNPGPALLFAAGVGFLLGRAVYRR